MKTEITKQDLLDLNAGFKNPPKAIKSSQNTIDLLNFILQHDKGTTLDISTSDYSDNYQTGYAKFDFHSTAPCVRGLIKRGIISGTCRWRYYEVEILVDWGTDNR